MSKKQVPVVQSGKLESGVKVGSKNWSKELECLDSFRYVPSSDNAPFTVRRERGKGQVDYWYGYRKVSGKLHKKYIGKTSDLTIEKLEEVAALLNIPPEPRKEKQVTDSNSVTNNELERLQQRVNELEVQLLEASKKYNP